MKQYETVIGLEVHVELATRTKIFCGCRNQFGAAPNTLACPVCAGMPGALPVLNRKVAEFAVKAGLALGCRIRNVSRFDRKNYFYPDNPQNYQISQLYLPVCHDGAVEIEGSFGRKKVRIHEIHMEEDAGKLVHDEWSGRTMVDYNRSGVPLIEIVTEPDMRSAEETEAFLEHIQSVMRYLGVSDCRLQEGSMRADVNLSVREAGQKNMGVRTEMKNLNSLKAIGRAIEGERERQIELLEEGRKIRRETRRWDDNKETSRPMRSKEDAKDYRYFPDPDLPPVVLSEEWIRELRSRLPEFREEKRIRYQKEMGLGSYDAGILTEDRNLAEFFEETVRCGADMKKAANWLTGEVLRLLKEKGQEPGQIVFSPKHLADLIRLQETGVINRTAAKQILAAMAEQDLNPQIYAKKQGLILEKDTGRLEEAVRRVLADSPEARKELLEGKEKVAGYFVGQAMKLLKGNADPAAVKEAVLRYAAEPEKADADG